MPHFTPPSVLWPDLIHPYAPILKPLPIPSAAPFDEPCECLFVNAEWRGYIVGVLEVLTEVDAWDGTEEQISATIDNVNEIIACLSGGEMSCIQEMTDRLDALAMCCLAASQSSAIENVLYQEHIAERYDGDPWSVDEDVPHDNWTETTGDSAEKIAQREAALCRAINRYLATIMHGLQLNRMIATGIAEISVAIASLANPILGIVVAGIEGILIGTAEAVWLDTDATKKCACCMYTNLTGEASIDFAGFQSSMQGCGFSPTSNEELQRLAFDGVNQQEGNYLAFLDCLGEETRLAAIYGGDTYDCDCASDWEIVYDFTSLQSDWEADPNGSPPPADMAVYTPSSGWTPANIHQGGTWQRNVSANIKFETSGSTLEYYRAYFDYEGGTFESSGPENEAQHIRVVDGGSVEEDEYQAATDGTGLMLEWTGSQAFDELRVYFRTCYFNSGEAYDGDMRLYRIEIGGSGDPPEV